jgi:hypothetical protein
MTVGEKGVVASTTGKGPTDMGNRTSAAIAALTLLALGTPASAVSIVGFSGTQATLTSGDNLTNDAGPFTSGTTPFLFLEKTIVNGANTQWVYLFHFDSPGNNGGDVAGSFQAQLDPGTNTVSILPNSSSDLAAQDLLYGVPGVIYAGTQAGRGLEGNDAFGLGSLNGLLQNFTYSLSGNGNNLDEVRFLVSNTSGGPNPTAIGVPEPATWATMILGFGMIGSMMRRRRSRTVACDLA